MIYVSVCFDIQLNCDKNKEYDHVRRWKTLTSEWIFTIPQPETKLRPEEENLEEDSRARFYKKLSPAPRLQSNYKKTDDFWPHNLHKLLEIMILTSESWKAESTNEPQPWNELPVNWVVGQWSINILLKYWQ